MAVVMTDGDIIQMTQEYRVNGQQCLLTFHWAYHETGSGPYEMIPTLNDLDQSLMTLGGYDTVFAACLSSDAAIVSRKLQLIKPSRYVYQTYPGSIANGTNSSPAMPQNVALVLTMRGDDAVPTNLSNKHLGAVPTDFVTGGMITPAGNAALGDLGDVLQQIIPSSVSPGTFEFKPIIFHRANYLFSINITSWVIGQTSRIMRRRTVGLGT